MGVPKGSGCSYHLKAPDLPPLAGLLLNGADADRRAARADRAAGEADRSHSIGEPRTEAT
jgi:hypothetical protein